MLAIANFQMFVQHGPNIEGLRHRSFAACPQAAFFVATLRHDGQIQGGASFTCAARLATASAVRSSRTTPLAMLLR